MTYRPCVVVPNFNHGYALREIVQRVAEYGLPIIVINDGSTDDTATTLNTLAAQYQGLTPLNRATNGGKGAAITDGLRHAYESGFSHALCIDGDGQHELKDIPRFLEVSKNNPTALILGRPVFGNDAPLVRRIGREFSNVAVAVSTWSFAARDVLCGFRVYPLECTNRRLNLAALEPRMGFDVEIVARAIWAGMPVVNVPTQVNYPRDGVSHFRYSRDNATLCRLEAKLIALGLVNGPRRVMRSFARSLKSLDRVSWHQIHERGNLLGLRCLLRVFELLGRWPLLVVMVPVVGCMFVCGGITRRAALDFQRRMLRERGRSLFEPTVYMNAVRQFWEFGVSIVDKAVSWRNGLPFECFTWSGRDEVKALLAEKRGVILMGAHVGNIEVVRALGESRQVIVNALMFTGNSRNFKAFLEEINTQSFLRVHDLTSVDAALIFRLNEALERGEIVALLADRVSKLSEGRVVKVPFLGELASFPEGPWILASLLEAPVYTVFSMRDNSRRYRVEFSKLVQRVELPRADRAEAIRRYVAQFATALADIVRRYPTQWYNFYDFWGTKDPQ